VALSKHGGGAASPRRRRRVAGLVRRRASDAPLAEAPAESEPAVPVAPQDVPMCGVLDAPPESTACAAPPAEEAPGREPWSGSAHAERPSTEWPSTGRPDAAVMPGENEPPGEDRSPGGDEPPGEAGSPGEDGSPAAPGRLAVFRRRPREVVRAALATVAVLGTGLAVWFGLSAHALQATGAVDNAALVDVATTNAVSSQIGEAVRTAFTYDYTNPASTRQAAQNVLTGNAIDQYNRLFAQVERDAPAQKLVLTTTVRSVGVSQLDGDRARVLVFVDQQALRTDNSQTNSGAAQLDIVAVRTGTTWKISDLNVL
jgi:Mce-associated membrane protein